MKRLMSVDDFKNGTRVFFCCCCTMLLCSGLAWAQDPGGRAVYSEIEPNDSKTAANPFVLVPGDAIQGVSISSTTTGLDYFRVKTTSQPLGVYRHRLAITTTGTAGHTGTIRGLTQSNGVISPTSDAAVQTSATSTTPPRMNQWYGFGKEEEIYYRVTGTASTTAPYLATMSTEPVTVVPVPGTFLMGTITISTANQLHTTDTDMWVYDSNLNAIVDFGNDDAYGQSYSMSTLTRTFSPGTYYLALSNWNVANNLASPADDDYRSGNVMDFANSAANSSTSTALNLQFSITDSTGVPVVVPSSKAGPFDINWFQFVVVAPSIGACCYPTGHCVLTTAAECQLPAIYHPGETCGTILPAEYHWEYPLDAQILPGAIFQNEQDGEDSTPIGKVRIDLKLIGILGPLHIEVEHLGTTVVLWNGVCQSSDGMDVIFDDDAVGTINCLNLTGGVPVSPAGAGGGHLSDFKGMEFGGPWTIHIYSGQYIIIIVRWSLWVQFLDQTFICVPTPQGACCLRDGSCIHTSQADCSAQNGTSWQYAVPCSFAGCLPVTGACCIGWECSIQTPEYCVNTLHGRYLGDNSTCDTLVREAYPGLAIPDNYPAGVSDTMNVQYDVTVSDVNVDLVINHTFLGDLIVTLTHDTTTATLWSRACSSNDNMNVILDDEGSSVTCATPTVGRIAPISVGGGLLSVFDGQSGRGLWTITVSDNANLDTGTLVQWSLHFGNTNPCAILDTVVCEAQPPNHPNTYWYDVTPGDFGRCDFHVRVYDPNPANYTNPSLPAATWLFLVHQVGAEWWASWWDPGCTNAIYGPNATRFQFTSPNASVWGDWRTTIGGNSDPYDVRNIDHSGHHTTEADGYGYRVHVPTFAESWYWKDCNGAAVADGYMPDFDQRQDFNGDGLAEAGYCGPTAVANSLWWFNCKFPLAGIVPAGWTPLNLIQDLAHRMDTNDQNPPSPHGHAGPFAGTYMDDMQAGIDAYLTARGVNNLLYEHTEISPTFDYISSEVQRSQDVTLLVGFWHITHVQQVNQGVWMVTWQRTGGHFLTVAGVDPLNHRVALSDPDGDFAEHGHSGVIRPAFTDHNHDGDNDPSTVISFRSLAYDHAVHNTDTYASHDYYALLPSISPGGLLAMVLDGDPLGYGSEMQAYHLGENNGPFEPDAVRTNDVYEDKLNQLWPPGQAVPPTVCQYYTEIEAAVVVSPLEACGPQPNGLACKNVVCPDQTQQCLPKKVRHYLPQIVFPLHGTDILSPTSGYLEIMDPTGTTETYTITDGLPNMTVVNRQDPVMVGDHREIQTEMVQLDLAASGGGGGGGGLVYVHLGSYHPSTGRVVGAPTTIGDYPAESFFDVYVEIDIPDLGMIGLHNLSPIPLADHGIHAVPPMGTQFETPTTGWSGVELFTADGNPTGLRIVGVVHILPSAWQVVECECMDVNACHIQLGDGAYCTGGCPQGYVCTELGITSSDGTYEEKWCQCLCMILGDMDHNYLVDGLDIQRFVSCVIENGSDCSCGDFNHNGIVDLGDISDFVVSLLGP